MSIKLPGRLARGRRQLAPANYGRALKYYPAELELQHVISRANAKTVESIAVDGTEILYWQRGTEGRYCTCSEFSAVPFLSDDIVANETSNITLAVTSDENTNNQIDMQKLFKVRGAWEIRESQPHPTTDVFGATIGTVPEIDGGEKGDESTFGSPGLGEDLADDSEFDATQTMGPDSAILFGGERTRCGICFRTSHINGYNLHNGTRIVLDATGTYPTDASGFQVNRQNHPYTFESGYQIDNYVCWHLELPSFFAKCFTLAVRNNTKAAKNVTIEYQLDGTSNWQPLTLDWLNSRNGESTKLWLRIRPQNNQLEGLCQFTHVELIYTLADLPLAQIQPISRSTNFGIFDTLQTSELVLPPTISHVDKEDVFLCNKYPAYVWKITDVTDFRLTNGNIMGWQATARVVQNYESVNLLRLVYQANYELSFDHLKPFQGLNNVSPNPPGSVD